MKGLSDKQKSVLDCIKNFIEEKKYPPTVRELCDELGIKSTSTIHGHLMRLERDGYIKRDPFKNRSIEIVGAYKGEALNIPVLGNVAAGEPLFAVENIESYFSIPKKVLKNENEGFFVLAVTGDSMIEKGIYQGDDILVRKQSGADNGDIVVALIDDSATVKTFYKEDGFIRLQPENVLMDPIIVKDVTILGKVIGLYRKF